MNEWAPEAFRRLRPGMIETMSEADFIEVCIRVHAMREHASRMDSSEFGLKYRLKTMTKDQRTVVFAKWLYKEKAANSLTACGVIDFVLYGGDKLTISDRLYAACYDPEYKIGHLGVSMLGEIIGWAMPDEFPPRNGRTSKALRALGYDVTIHSG